MIYSIDDLNQSIQIGLSQAKDQMKNLTIFTESEISLVHSQIKMTVKQILSNRFDQSLAKIDQSDRNFNREAIIAKEDLLSAQIQIDKALANLQISPPSFKEELSIFNLTLMTCIGGLLISASISPCIFISFSGNF